MGDDLLLAVDLGTESVRACLVDAGGTITHSARRPFTLHAPRAGWAEQDPVEWWEATCAVIREVWARAGERGRHIAGIGVCGQMHGPVPIGRDGAVLPGPVQLWCDKRAAGLVAAFAARPDAGQCAAIAGNPPTPAWMGFKILWEKTERPERYARVWQFLSPKDYLNFRLTGVPATDYSEASGSFLMDAARREWSEVLVEAAGLDRRVLPAIYPASSVIGMLSVEAAATTGLRSGIPVVAGGGDMLCLLLGAGVTTAGRACDTTGTASVLSVYAAAPVPDPRIMNLHHVIEGWIAFGICDSGGGALKWWKDLLRDGGAPVSDVYAALDEAAADEPPGADGLYFFPYLLGERTLGSPHARGVLFGLTPRHGRGSVARAIMEGVTFELRRALEAITSTGLAVEEMRTIGGGARSALWSAIKADVYRLPVRAVAEFEGGILGAAMLAGVGSGVFTDAARTADRLVVPSAPITPAADCAIRYAALYRIFARLHDLLEPGFDLLASPESAASVRGAHRLRRA